MRRSVSPWLTRPSSSFLSFSLSLSVVFHPTAWRIRYASSERGFEDLKTNYWIDVRQAVVSLPCFFLPLPCFCPPPHHFNLPPSSFSISAALTRRKTTCFFFVTLHCIDCLTCQCTVQFKPFFSCIAGRSKNIDLWHPTAALYCVFFFLIHWQSEIINRAVSTHTATQLYCFYCIYACSGAKPPFAALKKKRGVDGNNDNGWTPASRRDGSISSAVLNSEGLLSVALKVLSKKGDQQS